MLLWSSIGFGGIFFFIWLNNHQRSKRLQKRKDYLGNLKARLREEREDSGNH